MSILVAAMIVQDTDTEEESHNSGILIYDMKPSNPQHHMDPPLIGRIIGDRQAVDVLQNYKGLLLHKEGMHMVIAGPADGSQLLEICHGIVAMDCGRGDEL